MKLKIIIQIEIYLNKRRKSNIEIEGINESI